MKITKSRALPAIRRLANITHLASNTLADMLSGFRMNRVISHDDWLFAINSFRFDSPDAPGVLLEDRTYNDRNFIDTIENCSKSGRPLGLSITMPLQNTLLEHHGSKADHAVRKYLDHLLKEIHLLSPHVPKARLVDYLHWQMDISHLMTAAEMTELMYMLSRSFNMQTSDERRYVIELGDIPEDDAQIALIKGLGFNHVCLGAHNTAQQPFDPKKLQNLIQIIREYEFQIISLRFRIKAEESCEALTRKMDQLIGLTPDTICLIDEQEMDQFVCGGRQTPLHVCKCRQRMSEQLQEAGYKRLNHIKYSKIETEEHSFVPDLLGVGLGATSLLDNTFSHNVDQLNRYYEALQSERLPFDFGGYISH